MKNHADNLPELSRLIASGTIFFIRQVATVPGPVTPESRRNAMIVATLEKFGGLARAGELVTPVRALSVLVTSWKYKYRALKLCPFWAWGGQCPSNLAFLLFTQDPSLH